MSIPQSDAAWIKSKGAGQAVSIGLLQSTACQKISYEKLRKTLYTYSGYDKKMFCLPKF